MNNLILKLRRKKEIVFKSLAYKIEAFFCLLFISFYSKKKNKNNKKPKIVICRYNKYGNNNDVSLEKINLDDTLIDFEIDLLIYYWDEISIIGYNLIKLVKFINNTCPDLVIFSSYSSNEKREITQPNETLLEAIKKKFINKFVAIWWDTCSDEFDRDLIKNTSVFDLNIIIDNPLFALEKKSSINYYNFLSLFCPFKVEGLFFPDKKNIDVSFIGQSNGFRKSRKEYLDYLLINKENLNIFILTKERNNQFSYKEYVSVINKSKIGINFSSSQNSDQLKGRIFEIMLSGALLLESKNDQILEYFEENVDFVFFDSKEDLLNKINYYTDNENERLKIANNGREKVIKYYNSNIFWEKIFKGLELKISKKYNSK
jgi:hypothetical protein